MRFLLLMPILLLASCGESSTSKTDRIVEKNKVSQNQLVTSEIIESSNDVERYRDEFTLAAATLVEDGRCSVNDFVEMGGWMKSSNHKSQPIYFTYCGGMRISNRIYLNAATGEIYKE